MFTKSPREPSVSQSAGRSEGPHTQASCEPANRSVGGSVKDDAYEMLKSPKSDVDLVAYWRGRHLGLIWTGISSEGQC